MTEQELRAVLEPIMHWYQSDEQPERPVLDVLTDVITDLQQDRKTLLRMQELSQYMLQEDICNRLTPRVVDVAYSAFMAAKRTNNEGGGPTDWFNDTKPMVMTAVDKMTKDLFDKQD